ncbi:MAG: hypothetical protein R6U37_00580 [Dehalococcoidia bacterium]
MSIYEGIVHTVQFASSSENQCEKCGYSFEKGDLSGLINHYLEDGYRLLHIGTQSFADNSNQLEYETVVIMGN